MVSLAAALQLFRQLKLPLVHQLEQVRQGYNRRVFLRDNALNQTLDELIFLGQVGRKLDQLHHTGIRLDLVVGLDCHNLRFKILKLPVLFFESPQLLDKPLVGVRLLALRFHELKDIVELAAEEFHEEHDRAGSRARHAHRAVDKHAVFVLWVQGVDCLDGTLVSLVFCVLRVSGFTRSFLFFKVYLEYLAGQWEIAQVALWRAGKLLLRLFDRTKRVGDNSFL